MMNFLSLKNQANNGELKLPSHIFRCPTVVAILMATYNGDLYLKQQIDSILEQTYSDWTLYISDDGSTDETIKIINDYIEKYPDKIVFVESPINKGCSNNFYWLLLSVEANYYMLSDQDDVWFPDKIKNSVDLIHELNNTPALIGLNDILCDSDLNPIKPDFWYNNKLIDTYLKWNYAGVCCPISGAQMIINKELREIIIKNLGNELTYDHWICLLAIKYGVIKRANILARYYRIHQNNLLGNKGIVKRRNIFKDFIMNSRILKPVYNNWFKFCFYKIISVIRLRIGK